MNIKKQLVSGKGYAIVPVENLNLFKKLRDNFVNKINVPNNSNNNIDKLRKLMASMDKAQINKSMIEILKFTELSEMMVNSFPELIKSLCGQDLFIQRRATVIMNVPGKGQAKQWPHYELMSGVSPFTYIIWAPLHDTEEMSGAFYIERDKSFKIMKKEEDTGLVNGPIALSMMKDQKPISLKFGEGIIFNPFILHGNVSFESKLASIATTVRFQSSKKPLLQKNTEYLKFYKLN